MNKKLLLLVILLAVLLIGSSVLYQRLSKEAPHENLAVLDPTTAETQPTEAAGEEPARSAAPEFTVYDREGGAVALSEFRGKPVILNFWATWCGYCVQEMPDFEELFQTYGEQIHFLMINATDGQQETVEKATGFVDGKGFTFPVYFDTEQSAVSAYGIHAMPMTFFLDAEGNFVAYGQGMLTGDALQQGVDMLLE